MKELKEMLDRMEQQLDPKDKEEINEARKEVIAEYKRIKK